MNPKLFEDLFNKVPEEGKLVIFGACATGENILKDLAIHKPKTEVLGFIDNIQKGVFSNLPIWTMKEFIASNKKCDLVIMATQTDSDVIINCLDVYDIPVLPQTAFVSKYYRHLPVILNKERKEKYKSSFDRILKMFSNEEDKSLFEMLYKIRTNELDVNLLEDYFLESPVNKYHTYCLIKKQYLDKINKNEVKNLFDIGFHDGFNVIAYNKLLPNLSKIYGFEVIYDVVRKKYLEDFLPQDKLKIVPLALGDCNKELNFYINRNHLPGSFVSEITPSKINMGTNFEHRIVNVTTIDNFCEEGGIQPDFIKMDIEGAEMAALLGGIKTIQECRPQLAISIYHSVDDFIDIPVYLDRNLKNYHYAIGHYSAWLPETVLYAIPEELL